MTMNELISIITPCCNSYLYISDAINSVLSQTYTEWELIIIDDCSTDGSDKIIKAYCNKDLRIKYFKTEKISGSPAIPRNIGIENAKGKYIAFLDSDDIWFHSKLQEQIEFMNFHNYSFIYSNYKKISVNAKRNYFTIKTKAKSNYWDILKSCEISCLTVIIKKELIDNIHFRTILKEDYAFWLEIMRLRGITAYNTGKIHALYRESKRSRSSNKMKMIRGQWLILRKIEKIHFLIAIYCLIIYGLKGFLKYVK
ncbi:putative teichuronic acid biosynthesis glycosyltransferase TuaG [termite gut metagenome]|uniref:Putative teichuronic acid biosynthesis glycosyltransferase TuaG n=1 Tax=termite gut metagenome TaxID=433724 RepID=A0A5J4S358_9ZZZZ